MLKVQDILNRYSHLSREEFLEKVKWEWLVTDSKAEIDDEDAKTTVFKLQNMDRIKEMAQDHVFDLSTPELQVYPLIKRIPNPNSPVITVGRAKTNDIVIPDNSVSKVHAYFSINESSGRRVIYDMDSTNGTYLRGERLIPHVAYPLKTGDRIIFGNVAYTYFTARSFYDVFLS
ncbi:MAG: FHA domain-containing protein [Planctomycetota bacterium]|nr:MAG: FHA domain-containing protein [Planctomycetota bacterium]